jgi:hypothetical protein
MKDKSPGHAMLPSFLVPKRPDMPYKSPSESNLPNLPTFLDVASARL